MSKTAVKSNPVVSPLLTLAEFIAKCGSQEEAAGVLGVSHMTINRILKGHTKAMRRKTREAFRDNNVSIIA